MASPVSHQTLRRMTYFSAIAEAGSIREAARRLGLSAPVVSAALSELEAELNTTLLTRTTRKSALTAAGRIVHERVTDMLAAARAAQDACRPGRPLTGTVSISLPTELAAGWLPPLLAAFRTAHPRVSVRVSAEDAIVPLKASPHDLALRTSGATFDPLDKAPNRLHFPLECVALHRPDSRGSGDAISVDLPLIAGLGGTASLNAIDRKSGDRVTVTFREAISVNSRLAALEMARQELGCALLLSPSVSNYLRDGRLRRVLPELDFGHIVAECVFRDRYPAPEAQALADQFF